MVITIGAANRKTNNLRVDATQLVADPLCIGSRGVQVCKAVALNVAEQGFLVDRISIEGNVHGLHLATCLVCVVGTGGSLA